METHSEKKCAIIETLKIFSAKWKPCILCYLLEGSKRYGELHRLIPNISRKMLTQHLKELQKDGLVSRKSYLVIPPKVEYSLTEKGRSLEMVLLSLENWGIENLKDVNSVPEMLAQKGIVT